MDELLQPGAGVLAEPGGPADGPHPPAERDVRPPAGRLLPRLAGRAAGRGDHPGRGVAGRRLRHRHRGQVAPGPPARVPADPARLRLVVRHPLFERHGLAGAVGRDAPGRDVPSADGLLARSPHAGRDRRRTPGRPAHRHPALRRGGGLVHRGAPGPAVLPVPAPHHAPHAPVPFRGLPGPQRRRRLRRRHRGDRLGGGAGARDARAPRADRADPGGVHERQRPLAQLPVARGLGRPAAERQGDDLRGRHAGARPVPVAGDDRSRRGPGHRFGHGPVHHRRRPRGRRGARRPPHRRRRPDPGAARHGASAAGDHGLLPDGRAVRLPAGPLQGAFHDPEPLRRAQGVDATD